LGFSSFLELVLLSVDHAAFENTRRGAGAGPTLI
jgi:hypothetical protein